MKNPPIFASHTLARLYAVQGHQRQAAAIGARLKKSEDPQEVPQSGTKPDGQSSGPAVVEFSELGARMAQWIDLVTRYRFCSRNRNLKI